METTKKAGKKSSTAATPKEKIESAYIKHLLMEGKQPASVYKFCLDLGISETVFYDQYASFEALENHIWKNFLDTTVARLHSDESYGAFTIRERVLAFYFTLFEELKQNRSFVLQQLQHLNRLELTPRFLSSFKKAFEEYFERTLLEGKGTGEVANRPFLDQRYPDVFWLHFGFLLMFWKNDMSTGFEKTDAAIEKSVALAFDLIGKGALDSALDFAKFMYQQKR